MACSGEAMSRILGVPGEILSLHGTVSEEAAVSMAEGAAKISGTEAAVSITGFAGPENAPKDQAGVVYISCYVNKNTTTIRSVFPGSSANVRELAAVTALSELRRAILREYGEG